jgi:hypothetical protein
MFRSFGTLSKQMAAHGFSDEKEFEKDTRSRLLTYLKNLPAIEAALAKPPEQADRNVIIAMRCGASGAP